VPPGKRVKVEVDFILVIPESLLHLYTSEGRKI
jgi:hypothetical protein